MDSDRFDVVAKILGAGTTRRSWLALWAGLGLAQHAPAVSYARKLGKCQPACSECATCNAGKCKNKKSHNHGRKKCKTGTCEPLREGTPCAFPSGGACQDGTCTCPVGMANCNGACVDLQSDKAHCGACDVTCEANQVCQAGFCFARAGCPTSTTSGVCYGASVLCSTPTNGCICERSTQGNAVCVTTTGIDCGTPNCAASPTCPICTTDADCPAGRACVVDLSGPECGCPAGLRVCLPPCPTPIPARDAG